MIHFFFFLVKGSKEDQDDEEEGEEEGNIEEEGEEEGNIEEETKEAGESGGDDAEKSDGEDAEESDGEDAEKSEAEEVETEERQEASGSDSEAMENKFSEEMDESLVRKKTMEDFTASVAQPEAKRVKQSAVVTRSIETSKSRNSDPNPKTELPSKKVRRLLNIDYSLQHKPIIYSCYLFIYTCYGPIKKIDVQSMMRLLLSNYIHIKGSIQNVL